VHRNNAPRPAATVLVLRDSTDGPEVFMVRRHEGTGAFRGAHVFPGGRVDAEDEADASWCDGIDHAMRQLTDLPPEEALAFHVAAARELFEEAGVLLARDQSREAVSLASAADRERFRRYRHDVHAEPRALRDVARAEGLRLALDSLTLYAHWVTPPVEGRRFDTRFFVTRVPPLQTPVHDETETTEGVWITARAALAAATARHIVLPPPTWLTLQELEPFGSVDEILTWTATRAIDRQEPLLVEENGARMLVMSHYRTRFVWTDGYWRPERIEGSHDET
jgi:8-oxo-dGTP pyrophosphatase MutT (NUDIX family)